MPNFEKITATVKNLSNKALSTKERAWFKGGFVVPKEIKQLSLGCEYVIDKDGDEYLEIQTKEGDKLRVIPVHYSDLNTFSIDWYEMGLNYKKLSDWFIK